MYIQSQSRNRQNLSVDEYYCPLCRQLADVILPILPTGSDTPVIVVPPEQHVQCIKDIGAMLQQKPAIWVWVYLYQMDVRRSLHSLLDVYMGNMESILSSVMAGIWCKVSQSQ